MINNTPVGGWEFDDPDRRGNLTGGAGGFAIVDSDFLGIGNTEDTYLVSPIVDLSAVTQPVLSFDSDYHDLFSVADLDLSIDAGATWTNVWERAGVDARGPSHVALPIAAAAGTTQAQVRFHYTATWAWWWEVDNFGIGECVLQTGGLVVGTVTRSRPRDGLVAPTSPVSTSRTRTPSQSRRHRTHSSATGSTGCSRPSPESTRSSPLSTDIRRGPSK